MAEDTPAPGAGRDGMPTPSQPSSGSEDPWVFHVPRFGAPAAVEPCISFRSSLDSFEPPFGQRCPVRPSEADKNFGESVGWPASGAQWESRPARSSADPLSQKDLKGRDASLHTVGGGHLDVERRGPLSPQQGVLTKDEFFGPSGVMRENVSPSAEELLFESENGEGETIISQIVERAAQIRWLLRETAAQAEVFRKRMSAEHHLRDGEMSGVGSPRAVSVLYPNVARNPSVQFGDADLMSPARSGATPDRSSAGGQRDV